MKRLILAVLFICAVLCGCARSTAQPEEAPQWPTAMHTGLTLRIADAQFTADWSYTGSSAFVLKTPQELLGVTVRCEGAQSRIESGDVQADLPDGSVFVRLDGAYRAIANALVEPRRTQEGWLYDGMDRYGFEALAPAAGGSLSIRFPSENAEALFAVTVTQQANGIQ